MATYWVEVVAEDSGNANYFWNRDTKEILWTKPPGKEVVWMMTKDEAKRVYYWHKTTGEMVWTLPTINANVSRSSPNWSSTDNVKHHVRSHMASLNSVVDRTSEAPKLFPGVEIGLLFECRDSMKASQLFPKDFSVAVLPDDPPVSAGYLVVDLRATLGEAGESMKRLSSTWWEVTQKSALPVTLVLATTLPANGNTSEKDLCADFAAQHRRLAYQAPSTLLFAAWWDEKGGQGGEEDYNYDNEEEEDEEYDYGEEALFASLAAYLKDGPKEVQDLSANFAMRFNECVRMNPNNSYSPNKKNDGSFKKWLIARGCQMGALFESNKCMASLPKAVLKKAREESEKKVKKEKDKQKDKEEKKEKEEKKDKEKDKVKARGDSDVSNEQPKAVQCEPFEPPFGVGTKESRQLADEAVKHLVAHGAMDMGSLREVNQLGARFNALFWQKSKVNNGSWKKWLASLPGLEVCVDPKRTQFHGDHPTIVRPRKHRNRTNTE